ILEMGDGVFEVKSTNGDTALGGEDLDHRLVQYLIDSFKEDSGIDLSTEAMALQRLKEASESAKHELSSVEATDINLPFISADDTGPKHLNLRVTREKLEELVADLVERLVEPCQTALADAGFGRGDIDEVVLVGGQTRMPLVRAKVKEIFGKEPNCGVNPDEVVAVGAAIQGGVLQGEVDDVLLLDVTPLSLGVETQGGVMTKIIEKNTTVPTCKSQILSTTEDNQTFVSVHVLQGEREMSENNKTLGRFELVGIRLAPRGVPQIEITFDIDADGVVHVSAKDLDTGQEQAIEVSANGGLSEEEVNQLVSEAESNAASDHERRELAELRNKAEGLLYSTQRTLDECGDEVPDSEKQILVEQIALTSGLVKTNDLAELKTSIDELSELSYKMTEAMYSGIDGEDSEEDE
ncbi:MAG: Hsp70 family protein, partial [Deltaproteobacteria bacterium]|nr:Hsp70 family protein [Deltaproteobacteria bacterium]